MSTQHAMLHTWRCMQRYDLTRELGGIICFFCNYTGDLDF